MEISKAPQGLEQEFQELFTSEAVQFVRQLVSNFEDRAAELYRLRKLKKVLLDHNGELPNFQTKPKQISDPTWKVAPLPPRLMNRHLDLGDVAPNNAEHLKAALNANVQGIQVDFDDGCCPSWRNVIQGLHNIVSFARGTFLPSQVPPPESAPLLILRPRAWNMLEHNVTVNGKEIPGPLLDFGMLIFHTGKNLAASEIGPFFYLSKLEGANEAKLWNDIFRWSQAKLDIPYGTIKACVLIENILSSFEMEEILYELRDHSLGLNCGIWDYCASFVNKFGHRREFLLPDRNKYVNMDKHFLASYMKLVVKTCHNRGAMATGGMAAITVPEKPMLARMDAIEKVCKAKLKEIYNGVDGFMVYDVQLVSWINEMWEKFGSKAPNQISHVLHSALQVTPTDLLQIPKGGVTYQGLVHNVKVGILFIHSWLKHGRGHFILDGAIEDSATAEISRSQVWQWLYHGARLEDGSKEIITRGLVKQIVSDLKGTLRTHVSPGDETILKDSARIFMEIVTAYEFPEFITTFLYNHTVFRQLQET